MPTESGSARRGRVTRFRAACEELERLNQLLPHNVSPQRLAPYVSGALAPGAEGLFWYLYGAELMDMLPALNEYMEQFMEQSLNLGLVGINRDTVAPMSLIFPEHIVTRERVMIQTSRVYDSYTTENPGAGDIERVEGLCRALVALNEALNRWLAYCGARSNLALGAPPTTAKVLRVFEVRPQGIDTP